MYMWAGVPKLGGTILGVISMRTIVFWGLYLGSLILGNYHVYVYYAHIGCCKSSSIRGRRYGSTDICDRP